MEAKCELCGSKLNVEEREDMHLCKKCNEILEFAEYPNLERKTR
ncbi:MAG: hypothetical protein OH319_01945 [Candidatus Parvarchaeota archaeon]|nr:hypothetical protein [Candidatus Jingweiarchaeum tengchongense]MCW1298133.1 hypothetical protein [Candidatus Jingweiarchaeum tengchongense]MCW1299932.1 hypothetical protein [Candidatus Jingweiarchaeum tengchongense]MCW1305083.1 hypothetical protein [Candidatus Jingweiarchaeum tengchongense]MCW1305554.1 hypothetical protein [Candidatus Jingweiarchaeum tengchongense]